MAGKPVLVTGASGLLGRAIYQSFNKDPEWAVTGLAFSRITGALKKVDLTKESEVQSIINEIKPALVIHSAAERRPDVVEKQEDATFQLNVKATQTICEQAAKINAPVVYISTDYVFDGKNAPYRENDQTNPLNKYGQSKLEGEKVVMNTSSGNLILRVPILYGQVENLAESAVTILFDKVKDSSKKCVMSDYERRYPTHVDDVARVLNQLAQKRMQDPSLTGIFHWSGSENMTKYDMAVGMANAFNLPTNHIEADKTPSSGATRPYNAHLASDRIEALGICSRTPYMDGIKECLQPYL